MSIDEKKLSYSQAAALATARPNVAFRLTVNFLAQPFSNCGTRTTTAGWELSGGLEGVEPPHHNCQPPYQRPDDFDRGG